MGAIFMTTSMLKIFACLLMLIDHMGAAFFPKIIILRMIGRLSFPIFAYLIAIGYSKTNSFYKYLYRMLIFAAISQIPFSLAFSKQVTIHNFSDFLRFIIGRPYPHLNIFFTLAIGLLAIRIWDAVVSKRFKVATVLGLGIIAEALCTDYGIYGVFMILAFHVFRDSKNKVVISQFLIYLLFNVPQILFYVYTIKNVSIDFVWFNQALSLLALVFIFRYNGHKGKDFKYLFYVFYPLHLLILGGIKMVL